MKEIVELKTPIDRVNHDLDKYEGIDFFPEKTKRANEMVAKWGLPKEWEDEIQERKRENAFWIQGKLTEASIHTNSFLIVVEATNSHPQLTYTITALSDILNKLVKEYWGYSVNVHIKPKKETQSQYEFIDIV